LLSMSGKSSLTSTKDYFQGKKWEKKRLTWEDSISSSFQ
jgi:hypothetical protein